jgi:hypothetical protein
MGVALLKYLTYNFFSSILQNWLLPYQNSNLNCNWHCIYLLTVKLVACFYCHTTPTKSAFALSNLKILVSIGVVFPKYQYYLQLHVNPTFLALVLGIF